MFIDDRSSICIAQRVNDSMKRKTLNTLPPYNKRLSISSLRWTHEANLVPRISNGFDWARTADATSNEARTSDATFRHHGPVPSMYCSFT